MNTPWFDPNLAWIPGTVLGIIGGIFGATIGCLIPLSRMKKRPIGMKYIKVAYILFLGGSAAMLFAGIAAFISGQPYGIWYGLGLAGLIGVIVFGSLYSLIIHLPKQIEPEEKTQNN
jgi:CBS-domain-containing membrane protein